MRWIAGLFLLVSCRTVPAHSELLKLSLWEGAVEASALAEEEYVVLSVALKDMFPEAGHRPLIVSSMAMRLPSPADTVVPSEGRGPGRVENRFTFGHVHLLSRGEEKAYRADRRCQDGWARFWDDHQGYLGVVHVTRVGFSEDHSRAQLELDWQGGCLRGETRLYLLERAGAEWRVIRKTTTGVS